jgi:hypothetical protein
MTILGRDGEFRPILGLQRSTADALSVYCAQRWPVGRRKAIESEWGLTPDQARSVMEATASKTTIDDIWQHPRGGWDVMIPVMGAVIGRHHHEHLRARLAANARQQQELEHHALLAEAAHRRLSFPRLLRGRAGGRAAGPDRPGGEGRDEDGDLGSEEVGAVGRVARG